MSTWGIGDHHDSNEVLALKEQLRAKDAAHATLQGQYLKKEAELDDVKASLNDVLDKLRREADRVLQLDSDLKRRNEELANERLTRQNAEVALTAAHRKLKDSEQSALELQSTIDTISSQSSSTLAGRSKLEQDNASLQARVRALERELQSKTHAEELALRQSQSASGRNRRRSSSESSFRIPALEKQLADLHVTSNQQAAELQKTTEQLTRTRDALVQLQNEKTAAEKRLRRELEEVRATLDDREEDLRMLREAQGGVDVAAREADLLERLEEEEKRVAALENELARSTGSRKRDLAMLQDELDRTTKMLEDATRKASEAEERLTELAREKEEALDERDRLEQERARLAENLQVANSRTSGPEAHLVDTSGPAPSGKTPDEATVAMMEKLLNTIERLRGERDGLRRDLEFLNAENRFAVQSLEAKLVAATSAPTTPAADVAEVNMLRGHVQAYQEQTQRSARAVVALAIVAQHQSEDGQGDSQRVQELAQELSHMHEHLQHAQQDVQQRQGVIDELEHRLSLSTEALHAMESQVAGLRSTIQRLEDDLSCERTSHVETGTALADAEEKLCAVNLALTEAEAGRDALALEKTHLQQDLEAARQELADADERHAQQLNAISSRQPAAGAQAALRAQIQELEARVERRTAQIGMHQHDIARMEMNLKLQEERIAEMTAEMDVVQGEKDAMLEDCRATRDQRDEALRRCDELEEALESIERARETEVEELVHITIEAMAGRRDAVLRSKRGGSVRSAELACLEERVHAAESQKDTLAAQVSALSEERERLVQALDERTRAYDELRDSHAGTQAEAEITRAELSHLRVQLDEVTAAVRAAEDEQAATESEIVSLRNNLTSKEDELETVRSQLTALRDSHADRQSLEATIFAQEKAELETQLQDAKTSLSDLENRHQETIAELKRVEEELKRAEDALTFQLSESAVRSESEERLRNELSQVKKQHEEEVASLQDQLKTISEELDEVSRLRGDADESRRAAEEELAQTKQQLEARLVEAGDSLNTASRLEAELEQLKTAHKGEMQSLRGRLDDATAELDQVSQRRDELQALHDQATQQCEVRAQEVADAREKLAALETELATLREAHVTELEDLEKRLADATEELCTLRDSQSDTDTEQRQKMDELATTISELEGRIVVLTKEADECRGELEDEKAAHSRTRESSTAELREVMAQRDELEAALTEAEKDLPAVRAQLEHAESSLAQAEEEKLNLQYQVTNLEAEVQRSKSLQRFLENQAAESERHVATLQAELEELRAKCTALDKLAKNTEANLAMQTIQHEQAVASLKRELNSLRSQPSLEDEVAELKEKN
ncbi:hypothetical protein GY45DRAFT_1319021, partial [Cubamyces sp. BRFM 1775]